MRTVPKIACHSYSAIATTANAAVESMYDNVMNMVDTSGPLTLYGRKGASNLLNTDGIEIARRSIPVDIGMQSRDSFITSGST